MGRAKRLPKRKPLQVFDAPRTRRPSYGQRRPKSIGGPRPFGSVAVALATYGGMRTQSTSMAACRCGSTTGGPSGAGHEVHEGLAHREEQRRVDALLGVVDPAGPV